jgi:hypothetical protein
MEPEPIVITIIFCGDCPWCKNCITHIHCDHPVAHTKRPYVKDRIYGRAVSLNDRPYWCPIDKGNYKCKK